MFESSQGGHIVQGTLKPYGDTGWQWEIAHLDDITGDVTARREYRTNAQGEGLWEYRRGEARQIAGTCQFSLPNDKNAARRRIRYAFRQQAAE